MKNKKAEHVLLQDKTVIEMVFTTAKYDEAAKARIEAGFSQYLVVSHVGDVYTNMLFALPNDDTVWFDDGDDSEFLHTPIPRGIVAALIDDEVDEEYWEEVSGPWLMDISNNRIGSFYGNIHLKGEFTLFAQSVQLVALPQGAEVNTAFTEIFEVVA